MGMAEGAQPVTQPADSRPVERHHLTKGLVRLTMACPERCAFCNLPVEDQPSTEPTAAQLDDAVAAVGTGGGGPCALSGG